jgi:hypothetical protein
MAMESIDELYTQHIKLLAPESRLRLLALMAMDLAAGATGPTSEARGLLELEGLGAGIWEGVDANAYVRELRDEWSERP